MVADVQVLTVADDGLLDVANSSINVVQVLAVDCCIKKLSGNFLKKLTSFAEFCILV